MVLRARRGSSRLSSILPSAWLRRPLVPIAVAASIPILLLAAGMSYRAAIDERAASRSAAREVVDLVVERVTAELNAQMQVAEALALSSTLDNPDLPAFYREAARLKASRPLWHTVELDDPRGRQLVNLLRPLGEPLGETADRAGLDRVLSVRRSVVGGIGPVGPVSGRRLVTMRIPVTRGGRVTSVLTIAFEPNAISSILKEAGVPTGWVGVVVDAAGNVIARTLAETETLGGPESPDLRQEIAHATSGSYSGRTLEGLDCEVNFRTLSDTIGRWSVHIAVPTDSLNRPIYRSLIAVGGGGLASLALAAALAGFVSGEISRSRSAEIQLADAALDESDQLGTFAVEAAELGTWEWDFSTGLIVGSERCRMLFAIVDLPDRSLVWSSDRFLAALSADDRETVITAARQSLATGGGFEVDFSVPAQNEPPLWRRVRGRAMSRAGEHVIVGVVSDLTTQKRSELDRLQLLRRLSDAQEDVQGRIARELHDQVGQVVTGLSLGLKGLERGLSEPERPSGNPSDGTRTEQALVTVRWLQGLAGEIGRDIHRAAADLRPTALDDLGLVGAVRTFALDWSRRYGVRTDVQVVGERLSRASTQVETAVYRIVQEALTNVLKHAAAQSVSIVLEYRPRELRLVIEDDGQGFDQDAAVSAAGERRRLGLSGMRERLLLLGGRLEVESQPGSGLTLFAAIPLDREAPTDEPAQDLAS